MNRSKVFLVAVVGLTLVCGGLFAALTHPMTFYAPTPLQSAAVDGNAGNIPYQSETAVSTTPNYTLGTRYLTKTGKVFRYSLAGATALSPALMTQGTVAISTSFQDIT